MTEVQTNNWMDGKREDIGLPCAACCSCLPFLNPSRGRLLSWVPQQGDPEPELHEEEQPAAVATELPPVAPAKTDEFVEVPLELPSVAQDLPTTDVSAGEAAGEGAGEIAGETADEGQAGEERPSRDVEVQSEEPEQSQVGDDDDVEETKGEDGSATSAPTPTPTPAFMSSPTPATTHVPTSELATVPAPVQAPAPFALVLGTGPCTSSVRRHKWQEIKDSHSGRMYYYSETTQDSVWEKPKNFDEDCLAAAVEERLRGDVQWAETQDEHGRIYFYDTESLEARWDRPASLAVPKTVTSDKDGRVWKPRHRLSLNVDTKIGAVEGGEKEEEDDQGAPGGGEHEEEGKEEKEGTEGLATSSKTAEARNCKKVSFSPRSPRSPLSPLSPTASRAKKAVGGLVHGASVRARSASNSARTFASDAKHRVGSSLGI